MADSWGAPEGDGAQATSFKFGTDNEAFASSDTFAGGEAPQEEAGRIQEDKINKKKLAEYALFTPFTELLPNTFTDSQTMASSFRSSCDLTRRRVLKSTLVSSAFLATLRPSAQICSSRNSIEKAINTT